AVAHAVRARRSPARAAGTNEALAVVRAAARNAGSARSARTSAVRRGLSLVLDPVGAARGLAHARDAVLTRAVVRRVASEARQAGRPPRAAAVDAGLRAVPDEVAARARLARPRADLARAIARRLARLFRSASSGAGHPP